MSNRSCNKYKGIKTLTSNNFQLFFKIHFHQNNSHPLNTELTPTIVTFQTHWGMLYGGKIKGKTYYMFGIVLVLPAALMQRKNFNENIPIGRELFMLSQFHPEMYCTALIIPTSRLFPYLYKFALGALMDWFLRCLKRSPNSVAPGVETQCPQPRQERREDYWQVIFVIWILLWGAWRSLFSHFVSTREEPRGDVPGIIALSAR